MKEKILEQIQRMKKTLRYIEDSTSYELIRQQIITLEKKIEDCKYED